MQSSTQSITNLNRHFPGDIRTDAASRILYSTDASMYQIQPLGVAFPKSQAELQTLVELAVQHNTPILPRGAGTSLAGQAIGEALILDCSRWLNKIVEINPEEQYAIVEPGVVLADLNKAAAPHGLMFGPDPASAERATMGGVIANNATGAHSIQYGTSADHILSADVILGDGTLETWEINGDSKLTSTIQTIRTQYADAIKTHYPQTWRNAAGYRLNYLLPWSASTPPRWAHEHYPANLKPDTWNMAHLLAGSEGTLAVMRRIKVKLVRKPQHTVLVVLAYPSIAEACDDVPRLLTHQPSAIELIPQLIIQAARSVPAYARQMGWVVGNPEALLVLEFSDQPQALKEAVRRLQNDLGQGVLVTVAESAQDQARVWDVRKVGLGLMDSKPQSARPVAFIEDCAIPVERLGEFVREVEKILAAHGTQAGMYAHASAGCLHIRPILDLKTTRGVDDLRAISTAVLSLTLSLGGAMSSEHGDGLARSEHLARAYGPDVMSAMRLLKNAADPNGLLNPGKIIDPLPLDKNLRYGSGYRTQAWTPALSFTTQGSFELAVEQCNGQGVCRKDAGVMCPSFQATREEAYSTRGRANLLRELIRSTQYGVRNTSYSVLRKDELQESVFQALDLCLACKGCKAECPSGVDMAKLKYEFENEYYKSHRRPLRDYVFGYFHVVAGLLAPMAPLANRLTSFSVTRKLIAKVLGLAEERALPKFVKAFATERTEKFEKSEKQTIIFVSDVFSRYIEPEVEQAALTVLRACGYEVQVLPVVGAGASLLSKGFIDAAKAYARNVLEMLNQADPKKEAIIVGVEPPEVYLLKHEYGDLIPEAKSQTRAVWLLDEFLVRSSEFENMRVVRKESKMAGRNGVPIVELGSVLVHPHCHQRAEGLAEDGLPAGAAASVALLQACGFEVTLSTAGCCGMAGTFGFEADHYDVSMKVFERMKPLVTHHSSLAFTGAACRMQVEHGAGVQAKHPIVLVSKILGLEES